MRLVNKIFCIVFILLFINMNAVAQYYNKKLAYSNLSPASFTKIELYNDSIAFGIGGVSNYYMIYKLIINKGDTAWVKFRKPPLDSMIGLTGLMVSKNKLYISGCHIYQNNNFVKSFISQYDLQGKMLWTKYLNIGPYNYIANISTSNDNMLIASGVSKNPSNIYSNYFLAKFDTLGNAIWNKTYLDTSGFGSVTTSVFEHKNFFYFSGVNNVQSLIYKIDLTGNVIWKIAFPALKGLNIYKASDNAILVLADSFPPNSSTPWKVILKVNTDGVILWNKKYAYNYFASNNSSAMELKNGDWVINCIGNNAQANLLKITSKGDSLWSRAFYCNPSKKAYQTFYGLNVLSDGDILQNGYCNDNFISTPWLVKTNCIGAFGPPKASAELKWKAGGYN